MQIILASFVAVSICGELEPNATSEPASLRDDERFSLSDDFSHPEPLLARRSAMSIWATHYSVPRVKAARDGYALLDPKGRALGPRVSRADFCRASLQGTVEVVDDRGVVETFAFAGVGDGEIADCARYYPKHPTVGRSRFVRSGGPRSAYGSRPVPFRTIAADPQVLKAGTILYVPSARGTVISLPSGGSFVHDGYFHVADVGGGVKGNHIDVFLGSHGKNPFGFVKSTPTGVVRAFVLEGAPAAGSKRLPVTRLVSTLEPHLSSVQDLVQALP